MKNIVVFDCVRKNLFKDFIHHPDFNVIACVVSAPEEKAYCLKHGIEAITMEEADFLQDLEQLDFKLIEDFRATQRKVEFGMMRNLNSNMLIANKYYNALSYFYRIFTRHSIDCVFVTRLPHGFIPETILLDMGKFFNIPTYCISATTPSYSSILRYDRDENIATTAPLSATEVTQDLFYAKKTTTKEDKIKQALEGRRIYSMLHKWGGMILIEALSCIKRRSLKIHMGFYKNMRFIEKLYSFYRLKEMQRFYTKHAISLDPKQKYIFFALHFEPEAVTSVIMQLQNQLTIIQLLASALPKGWLLLLKDHPHQYGINNILDNYFLTNIQFFKDKSFYEEVLKLPNVRLITLDTPSDKLIEYSQAIASIRGNIILEAIHCAKPCITFDNSTIALTQKNIFSNIHVFKNLTTLKQFILSLTPPPTTYTKPTQEQYQELGKYYFKHHEPKANETIISSLVLDLSKT